MKKIFLGAFILLGFFACNPPVPQETNPAIDESNLEFVDKQDLLLYDTVYVPIYSDIYSKTKDVKFNLTATLSIRNTSLSDSIYIEDIDYYDSHGKMVRQYLDKVLLLIPMQSVEYVIEEDDWEGGPGANFIVNWGANTSAVYPLFQGVMISTHGQQGISFMTEGVSIKRKQTNSLEAKKE